MPCRYSHGYAKTSWNMAECSVGLIFVKQPDGHNPLKIVFLLTSEASLKVPETLDHFWVDIWLLNSGLIGLNEWFAFLLKKETLAAIGQIFVPTQFFSTQLFSFRPKLPPLQS